MAAQMLEGTLRDAMHRNPSGRLLRQLPDPIGDVFDPGQVARMQVRSELERKPRRKHPSPFGLHRQKIALLAVALGSRLVAVEDAKHAAQVQRAKLLGGQLLRDSDPRL